MSSVFVVILLSFSCFFVRATELPTWHMKPLGSHVKPDTVDETFTSDLIHPKQFAADYVLKRKPLVFRNIVKDWPAYSLWTDSYLSEKYGDLELRIEGKREKQSGIPKGDICLGRDRMKTFLGEYKQGANKYVVSDLPTPMWSEVNVPPPMACGEFVNRYVEIDLWMNSDLGKKGKGGNSILHKDAFNTVNCVVNGSKEWKLIELQYNDYVYQSWEGPMDAGYGGFSLVNPEQVDAKKFPDVGKIPRWQFTTIYPGDCLYLPSQVWHQVKSFGETNRAVAFLFSKFDNVKEINTTDCPSAPTSIPLSKVDVDWQYPGYGMMPMGNSEISEIKSYLVKLLDKKRGIVTKRKAYKLVEMIQSSGAKKKWQWVKKAKLIYEYLLNLTNGDPSLMDENFIESLSRDNIRDMIYWIFPVEPHGSYEHEYSYFLPEQILELIDELFAKDDGRIIKTKFIEIYQKRGGTFKFAEDLWDRLGGEKEVVDAMELDESKLRHVVEKYEYYRREDPDTNYDENDTIVTPQGHQTQPRKHQGGYETIRSDTTEDSADTHDEL